MEKLHIVKPQHSLIYGMKIVKNTTLEDWQHEHLEIPGPDGEKISMVMHVINGSREEIRAQLMQSIDAFFELFDQIS